MVSVAPGLAGVVVAETEVGGVRGTEGFFHYRQFSASELARHRTLEDVWHLLHRRSLPDAVQLDRFRDEVAAMRRLPSETCSLLGGVASAAPDHAPALTWVRTGLSLVAQTAGLESWIGGPETATEALRLAAVLPTVVAVMSRARSGLHPIEPRDDLGTAANLLWMLEGRDPDPRRVRALEQYLVLTVDHGFNASTFASRVVASTGADLGAAVVAGIAALSGPLHGGAPSLVVDMLNAIGRAERAERWAVDALDAGEVIMGFGHRVYRTEDPRSELLEEIATRLGGPFVQLALDVRPVLTEVLRRHRPGRDLRTNVEFFAGVVLHELGIARDLYPALFAVSRTIGWTAHVLEQIDGNRIYRPASTYVGPAAPAPLPTA